MADSEKTTKPATGAPPESPTTARPLDFDDDVQESVLSPTANDVQSSTGPRAAEDVPPPKPPRPLSPREQAELTLREAFPSIDAGVVKAVLAASGGRVEPAFNALLGMTDPDAVKETEPEPPARPPRPTGQARSQLEADEQYARQLAEHYSGAEYRGPPPRQQSRRQPPPGGEYEEREHSFFDDDLPVIRENLRKGFQETQSTVNRWVANFKKKLDGDDEENDFRQQPPRTAQSFGRGGSMSGRAGDASRRSADRERYDADPQVLGDDFSTLELRDAEAPPPRPPRPLANPDLFKPTPAAPSPQKVGFQDLQRSGSGQDDMYGDNPKQPPSTGKSSKWQPLAAVDPSPVADNDPFSLGDSDDEKDAKTKDQSDEAERLQKATAEAMSGDIGGKETSSKPS